MSAHASPAEVHARLGHPVIDGDGHWVEYTPVFAEKIRKAVGDKAATGFSQRSAASPIRLSLSTAERKRRGVAHGRVSGAGNRPTPATAPPR